MWETRVKEVEIGGNDKIIKFLSVNNKECERGRKIQKWWKNIIERTKVYVGFRVIAQKINVTLCTFIKIWELCKIK